ncbi:MAG: hypothetical protein H6735_34030 [Alphaproteobacteria bacterium]|nr:hypothetical protein [Alphaproteobacteria bacterium]
MGNLVVRVALILAFPAGTAQDAYLLRVDVEERSVPEALPDRRSFARLALRRGEAEDTPPALPQRGEVRKHWDRTLPPLPTKDKLDRFTEQLGLKKNFVVEQALLFFMESRRELPDEAFVPTRLVLDDEHFDELVARLEGPGAPTDRLVELMRG